MLGVIVFIICFANLGLQWTFHTTLVFALFLIGGSLIQASIIIATCSLSLKFVRALAVRDTLIYNVREFINYPISIYSRGIQVVLTFIVPYAFVNFYPAEFLLGKNGDMVPPIAIQFLPILLGSIMFVLAYLLFSKLVNQYASTGS